ncbi:MAG: hypothetical protein K0U16_07190 [Gammaproteobacteria bacterium]|nr:hypothetical protein [Gammaproteobacteria bacterium]
MRINPSGFIDPSGRINPAFSAQSPVEQPVGAEVTPAMFRRVTTLDTAPVSVPIFELENVGDAVQIRAVSATARGRAGGDTGSGMQASFVGAALRQPGGIEIKGTFNSDDFGVSFAGSVALGAVGDTVVVVLTGIAATIDWTVSWDVLPVTGGDVQ